MNPGAGGHCWPQTTVAVLMLCGAPATGAVSVAGTAAACQSVAGLPSTAANGGAPGCELVAAGAWQRTTSVVESRSGRRVGSDTLPPVGIVCVPDGVFTGSGEPLLSVTFVAV